jgi:BlaI family penicillinase repressor
MGRKPKKAQPLQPTPAQLSILEVLWDREAATVREVHEALQAIWPVGYTTTLKMLQLMTEKGLTVRETEQRSHVYRAAVSRPLAQRRMVSDLLERAFGGSLPQLLLRAMEDRSVSQAELDAIRKTLDDHKRQAHEGE